MPIRDEDMSTSGEPPAADRPTEIQRGQTRTGADRIRGARTYPGARRQIDQFQILRQIGAGGMGEVYEAQQLEPVRRRVALKLIKRGMDTDTVVARFEAERQALALMNHSCIARVFDGGATDDGRPYFVMEYVEGVSLTAYAEQRELSTQARLELFLQVCDGVQHAHQRGIIHRDLKPTNVLVTLTEGKALPKIIDFGLAKATGYALTERTLFTELGQFMGTPEYMSPEQAEMSGLDVDTRTDVYALGVILYELLTGSLPYDSQKLRSGSYEDIRRRIREDEPQRPSVRVRTLLAAVEARHDRSPSDLAALHRELRGDLDWIVMKAMEKEREHRYQSTADLAADIERHLRNEPVLAGPPSRRYRMRKFVRRHRVAVVTVGAITLAMILGMVGTTAGLVQARRAQRVAQEEAASARQIADFLVGLFKVANPESTAANRVTAREILDRGANRIERDLKEQPLTQARLLHTMGSVYKNLGLYTEARPLLETSIALRRGATRGVDQDLAASLSALGNLALIQGRLAEAESLLVIAVAEQEALAGPDAPEVASALSMLGAVYVTQARYDAAEPLILRSLSIWDRSSRTHESDRAPALRNLGILYWRQGRLAEAASIFERAIAAWDAGSEVEGIQTAQALNNLGIVYRAMGRLDDAVPVYERAIGIYESILGPEHTRLAGALSNLGLVLQDRGDYEAAEPLLQRALAILEKQFGPDHMSVATALNNLANLRKGQRDYAGAEAYFLRALAIREKELGPDHPDLGWTIADLGVLDRDRGDYAKSESYSLRALEIFEKANDSNGVFWAQRDLAVLCELRGDLPGARDHYERALAVSETGRGGDDAVTADCLDRYAALLTRMGQTAEAAQATLRAASLRSGTAAQ